MITCGLGPIIEPGETEGIGVTKRERLTAIFRGQIPDRPAVRLWGARPDQELLHPAYRAVRDAAVAKTDLIFSAGSPFDLHWGAEKPPIRTEQEQTGSPEWVDDVTHVDTPAGPLRSTVRASTLKKPGYTVEHLLKEPADLAKLLSVPYVPYPFDAQPYWKSEAEVGDRGITMFGVGHAMYGLQTLTGSENFAFWSIDCRDALVEVMDEYGRRLLARVKEALAAGIRGVFGWVGPELCIPPLMSVRDFDEFVTPYDRAIIDAIHEAGGSVWVHCHGKMGPVLERFMEMGVDVLNPIEPPPMGDVTLDEVFQRVGDGMGVDGNIEAHDVMTLPADRMRQLVRERLECGRGRRLILCPSSGYMEDPQPGERLIDNTLIYINEGVSYAESMATG